MPTETEAGTRSGILRWQARPLQIPCYVQITDEFPMTVTGKVRKVEMREKSVEILRLPQ